MVGLLAAQSGSSMKASKVPPAHVFLFSDQLGLTLKAARLAYKRIGGCIFDWAGLAFAAALLFSDIRAQANNLLTNPGFEANGGQVIPNAWTYFAAPTVPASRKDYWVAADVAAHSGTLYWKQWDALANSGVTDVAGIYQDL